MRLWIQDSSSTIGLTPPIEMFRLLFLLFLLGFECVSSNFIPQESSSILSDGPPKILEKYPRVISASVGGSVKLACPLERPKGSDPNDSAETIIVWRKSERVIGLGWERFRVKDDSLSIRDVQEGDTGNFTCTATNGFGSVVGYYLLCVTANQANPSDRGNSQTAEFCVSNEGNNQKNSNRDLEPDSPKFVGNVFVDTVVQEGDDVTLSCQVQSLPSLHIQWFRKLGVEPLAWRKRSDLSMKQLNRVTNSSNFLQVAESYQSLKSPEFLVTSTQIGTNTHLSKLTFIHATTKDAGIYVCFASNSRGFNYELISLRIIPLGSEGSFLTSNSNVSWVAAFVVCVLSLVIVVMVILLVRRCRTQKEQKCRTQLQVQSSHPQIQKPLNSFPVTVKNPVDNRTMEFYPPHNMEYNQMDQADPFISHRQLPLYPEAMGPSTNSQIFHPIQLPFLPSTTSSDKTISSYQSLHPEERCNPHGIFHHNRNPVHAAMQWSHNHQAFC